MSGHSDTVTGLSLSPDGALLLSNAMDNTLRVWDTRAFVEGQVRLLVSALLSLSLSRSLSRSLALARALSLSLSLALARSLALSFSLSLFLSLSLSFSLSLSLSLSLSRSLCVYVYTLHPTPYTLHLERWEGSVTAAPRTRT